MKTHKLGLIAFIILLFGCEEKIFYKDDPRLYNDAYHGSIVGKIIQTGLKAQVIINQENLNFNIQERFIMAVVVILIKI